MIFLSPFLDVTGISIYVSISNSFFPHTAKLWNSLPIECFPLTYELTLSLELAEENFQIYSHQWSYTKTFFLKAFAGFLKTW